MSDKLTAEELNQIREEAKKKYPYIPNVNKNLIDIERLAHIVALTSEREKVKPLLEALGEWKECDDNYLTKSRGFEIAAASAELSGKIKKLKTALSNYYNKPNEVKV